MAGSPDFTTNAGTASGRQQSGDSYTQNNGYNTDQGFQNRNSFGGTVGGADTNVNRYRQMGQDAGQRGAYQADYSGFNSDRANAGGARADQGQALDLIRARAQGQGPSAAEISGRSAMDTALANTVAAAGSARGGAMQQQAAISRAGGALGREDASMTAGIQAGRANEIANAQGALMQGTTAMRGQDYQGAGVDLSKTGQDIQNEQAQRQLNQQGQEFYEQQAHNTNAAQLQANQNAQAQANAQGQANIQNAAQSSDFGFGKVMQIGGAVAGAGTGALGAAVSSDERMKMDIKLPGGAADPAMEAQGGEGWTKAGYSPANQYAEQNAAVAGAMKHAGGDPVWGKMTSDEEAKTDVRAPHDASAKEPRKTGATHAEEDAQIRAAAAREERSDLDEGMRAGTEGADPYRREPETGVAGAPRGYAASRAGQPGSMFGSEAPTESDKGEGERAPGTADFERYGASAAKEGDPDWKRGGATAPAGGGSKLGAGLMGISQSLLGSAFAPTHRYGGRDVMMSDDKTKLREAYEEGSADATSSLKSYMQMDPKELDAAAKDSDVAYYVGRAKRDAYNQALDGSTSQSIQPLMPPSVRAKMGESPPPPAAGAGGLVPEWPPPVAASELDSESRPVAKKSEPAAVAKAAAEKPQKVSMAGRIGSAADRVAAAVTDSATGMLPDVTPAQNMAEAPTLERRAETAHATLGGGTRGKAPARDTTESDERAKSVDRRDEPMARANRALEPSEYRYKPQFTPPGQTPGEKNVGPMANNMAADPVAKTAIVQGDDGLLAIDKEKGLKLALGGLGALQRQVDELKKRKAA